MMPVSLDSSIATAVEIKSKYKISKNQVEKSVPQFFAYWHTNRVPNFMKIGQKL